MRSYHRYLSVAAVASLLLLTSCSDGTITGPETTGVVIRACLYTGEAVTDIRISEPLPLGSEETVMPPVNDAEVSLLKDGITYLLVPSAGDSGYYHYPGSDLSVGSGDHFELHVVVGGQTATARTVVPEPPENVTASQDSVLIPVSFTPGQQLELDELTLTWNEVEGALWYVVIENIEDDPEPVESDFRFGGGRPGMFISPPTTQNTYRVRAMTLTHYGTHRARVYRINQEYADLYSTRQQDSRDLNEPLTNITNGLGVFSAFSSREVTFEAAPAPAVAGVGSNP